MCENHVAWSLFKASNSESGTFPAAKIFVGLTKKNLESDIWVNAENSERQRNKAHLLPHQLRRLNGSIHPPPRRGS